MTGTPELGLLLLTGGASRRFGAPKHLQPHPQGGTWAGHLVRTFRALSPVGPVQVLGEPVPEWPDLPLLDDPREGPAVALRRWAASGPPPARRWWIVACDQIRWTPEALRDWLQTAEARDPRAAHWVLALQEGHVQVTGSLLPGSLTTRLAHGASHRLQDLPLGLPTLLIERSEAAWRDIDRLEDLQSFRMEAEP